jgi:alanyl-tRNA synthetase
MKKMTSNELRTLFLNYFQQNGHTIVPSSPLIPGNDPTLLFTNAGMVQFKDVFLGKESLPYTRAASSQRCVRAGGKHNDLENVGYTARHLTLFEMLGNFSFGDYFKNDAIHLAWRLLTEELKLPPEKLWVSVYEDDKGAEDIWLNTIKIDPNRFSRCGAKDNFWSMGDTGPCGPCTEIFYDHGPSIAGGPPGSPDEDGDRYVEIWNLVFMQYDRSANGELKPLPKPSVDTGMGLERLTTVMQGVHTVYDTDIFRHLITAAAKLANLDDLSNNSLRVISDHIRSCSFLIADGVVPSNEGRGYVLRRIIRRAIRHGKQLGIASPFFYLLVQPLIEVMGDAYPELIKTKSLLEQTLKREEEQFIQTLDQGLKSLEQTISHLHHEKVIPGETVFKLYDTYGFPVDLTADIARERDLSIDFAGFEQEMEKQRKRSQETSKFELDTTTFEGTTEFHGYEKLVKEATITHIYRINKNNNTISVNELHPNDYGYIVLDHSPFYAEGGGQVGDQGLLEFGNKKQYRFIVENTIKKDQAFLHYGHSTEGNLKINDAVHAIVDKRKRLATALNHSATHLLHAALRQILGDHVTQKGSLVDPDKLRFDFSHAQPLTAEEIKLIENLVNQEIRNNEEGVIKETTPDEAIKNGAMGLFGEKYGSKIRTLKFGDFSHEICGGTHVHRTGDIGLFKITNETGIAAGIRRIEAVTGKGALDYIAKEELQLQQAATLLKTSRDNLNDKLEQLVDRNRTLEKQLEQLQQKLMGSLGSDLINEAKDIKGIKILAKQIEGVDNKALRNLLDQLKNKFGTAAIVLASVNDNRVTLVAGVTKDTITKIKAGELVNFVAEKVGGKGGGRPDLAEAGGNQPEALAEALASVPAWIEQHLH